MIGAMGFDGGFTVHVVENGRSVCHGDKIYTATDNCIVFRGTNMYVTQKTFDVMKDKLSKKFDDKTTVKTKHRIAFSSKQVISALLATDRVKNSCLLYPKDAVFKSTAPTEHEPAGYILEWEE